MSPAPQRRFHPDEQAALPFIENVKTSRRFRHFLAQHPEVYREIVRLAREAKQRGHERYSMKGLWEVARWNLRVEMDNNLTSFMSRYVMDNNPDLAGFFELREQRVA